VSGTAALSLTGRALVVVENCIRHLAAPAANLLVSFIVIRGSSAELWGRFAVDLIVVNLGIHLLAWGNKEYLLRAMSTDRGSAPTLWQSSLVTRSVGLPLIVLAIVGLGIDPGLIPWLIGWTLVGFVYQSFDVVVLLEHRFRLAIAAELVGLATTGGMLLGRLDRLDEAAVVAAWVVGLTVKTTVLAVGLAPMLRGRDRGRFDLRHLRDTLPFVLLALAGLLQSRVDLYAMALLADPGAIGRYQVTIGLYIALQAIAAFIQMPFVGELYENSDERSHTAADRLAILGAGIVAVGSPVMWVVLNRVYGFGFGWPVFLLGGLMAIPIYRYVPRIYLLYKHHRERTVIVINLTGAALNFALALLLIPRWSILGGLAAAALSQWFILGCYELVVRGGRAGAASTTTRLRREGDET